MKTDRPRWQGCRLLVRSALFLSGVCCASLPNEAANGANDGADVGVAVSVSSNETDTQPAGTATTTTGNSAAPTNGGSANQGGNATHTTPTTSTPGEISVGTTRTGVSIRLKSDHSKCIARGKSPPTEGDPLALASCSDDVRQVWMGHQFNLFASEQYTQQFPPSGAAITVGTGTSNRTNGQIYGGFCGGSGGYLSVRGGQFTVGTAVVVGTNNSDQVPWDFTGPGNAGTGFLLSMQGSASLCLNKVGESLALTACNRGQASQRWQYLGGCLLNDSGGYLAIGSSGSPPDPVVKTGSCPANVSNAFTVYGIALSAPSQAYFLSGDASTGTVSLVSAADSQPILFTLGGAWSAN